MMLNLVLLLVLLFEDVLSVEILSLNVPSHVQVGKTAVLICNYEMGQDDLYSVKWYKGNDEFYRYVPKDKPPGQVFKLKGVTVNQTISNKEQVALENVDLATSGTYKCEISAEAPSFQTVFQTKNMQVVNPPDEGPTISGGQTEYRIGDTVRVNCSTIRSSPAAKIEWLINGKKAVDSALRVYPSVRDKDSMVSSVLGLEFQVAKRHFETGGLTLRCVARVHPFYVAEHSISGEHRTANIMESKGSLSQVINGSVSTYTCHLFHVMSLLVFLHLR